MKSGENYLSYNPHPAIAKLGAFSAFWRSLAAAAQTFTPGDDLSHWNTINNWTLKQAEMKFSVLKLGEGGSPSADANLYEFAAQAKASNTQVMAYWFFRSNVTGELQAAQCLALAETLQSTLGYKPFLWADVETVDGTSNATRISRLQAFLNQLSTWNPGKVGIYTSPGFANVNLTPLPTWINSHWHWVAHWTSAALPTQPAGWDAAKCVLWQIGYWNGFSWCLPVPGAEPSIDRNKYFGDEAALTALTGFTPTTPPIPPIPPVPAPLPMTHKINTAEPNGVKLRAYPDGSEAVMLANGVQVRQLQSKVWKSQRLYAALVGGVWVSGWLADTEVLPL